MEFFDYRLIIENCPPSYRGMSTGVGLKALDTFNVKYRFHEMYTLILIYGILLPQ